MHTFKNTGLRTTLCALSLTAVMSCAQQIKITEKEYPVSWSSGLTIAELLSEEIAINDKDDLQRLLHMDWYTSIDVINTRSSGEASFANCNDYLTESTPATRTLRENEMPAFLELAMMCRASETLARAGSANISYIPSAFINASSPEVFPAGVALEISATEAKNRANDPAVRGWSDVNNNFGVETISANKGNFHHDAGTQQLEWVGRGDLDGDKVEDVLISSRDSVQGGSYFNLRLFALTADANGTWRIIGEYGH